MLSLVSLRGVVGAVERANNEVLILCDAARGSSPDAGSRGFYRLGNLAGCLLPVPVFDDAHSLARHSFKYFLSCMACCAASGLTYFSEGHAIFCLDRNNTVYKLAGSIDEPGSAEGRDGMLRFTYPSELAAPDPHLLFVTDSHGLHALRLTPSADACGGPTVMICSTVRFDGADDRVGALCTASCAGRLAVASATAIYCQDAAQPSSSCDPSAESSAGTGTELVLWAGEEGMGGRADGQGAEARFSSIAAVGDDGCGGAIVVDARPDGTYSIRGVSSSGEVSTICSPADDDNYHHSNDFRSLDYGDALSSSPCAGECSSSTGGCGGVGGGAAGAGSAAPYGLARCDCADAAGAFRGGGLRSPLVLRDGTLLLCATAHESGALVLVRKPRQGSGSQGLAPDGLAAGAGSAGGAAASLPAAPAGPNPCCRVAQRCYGASPAASGCGSTGAGYLWEERVGFVDALHGQGGDLGCGFTAAACDECTSPGGLDELEADRCSRASGSVHGAHACAKRRAAEFLAGEGADSGAVKVPKRSRSC